MPISISLIADASAKPALAFADLLRTCFQINSVERNPSQETYYQMALRKAICWGEAGGRGQEL